MKPGSGHTPWVLGALLVLGVLFVGAVVIRVATSTTPSTDDGAAPPVSTAPKFSIPKVQGCQHTPDRAVAMVEATLRDALELRGAYSAVSGDVTYIAGRLSSNGHIVLDDPALWAIRGNTLFAVGSTQAVSSAKPADAIAIHGDDTAAARVISCAAGY